MRCILQALQSIARYFRKRSKIIYLSQRKLPRIPVGRSFAADTGHGNVSVRIEDFNFQHCRVTGPAAYASMNIRLPFSEETEALTLRCRLERRLYRGRGTVTCLYAVQNWRDFAALDGDALFCPAQAVENRQIQPDFSTLSTP